MTSLIAKAGLAALVALTGLSALAPAASAASPELAIQVQYRDRDRDRDRDWRPDRPHRRPQGCAPGFAENKANRLGLRRTRVVDVSRRTVTVVGFGRRGPERIVFANVRGCPVIR
jgi:Ni/Co efflux regulator RcnB